MNKYKKLLKNIIYFFAGNMGSKILIFLLVPYYTNVLSTSEYGTADLISTTAMLIIPIITLSITEAVFRFSMDKTVNSKELYSNGLFITIFGNLIFIFLSKLLNTVNEISQFLIYLQMLIIFDSLFNITAQFVRGKGYTGVYAISGVVQTCALISFNLLFLLVFKLGVKGYILSMILSYIVSILYITLKTKIYRFIGLPNFKLLNYMLKYSIPMIPSSLSWWAMSSADKYILSSCVGLDANGIYLVAQKIPTILNVFITIFQQAWQISAIDESLNQKGDIKRFSEKIFTYLQMVLFIFASILILILKPLYSIWVNNSYFDAWECTPLLLLATVYSCMAQFMTTNYIVTKRTLGNLKVTMTGCLLNIVLNLIWVPKYGMLAAAFTTFLGYFTIFLMTRIDLKKTIAIEIKRGKLFLSTIIVLIQGISLYLHVTIWIPLEIILIILHLLIYKNEISKMCNTFKILLIKCKNFKVC